MENEHYKFTLMPLPYAYDALEPYIDTLVRKHKILLKSVDICKIRVCGLFFCQILANIG